MKRCCQRHTAVLALPVRRMISTVPEKPETGGQDPQSQVRAYGSLAQEVMDQGVTGVVAMRYNVYVVTAAQFVAELYEALGQGQALGEAVTMGRKQLADKPLREIAYAPCPLPGQSPSPSGHPEH
jgi:hypothetical protein